jgi:hypothetical protein
MSAYMPLIKLTQRRKDAKVLRLFYYGRTTGHDITLYPTVAILFYDTDPVLSLF